MQQQPPPNRRAGSIPPPSTGPSFDEKLENEEAILDGLLTSLSRAQLPASAWDKLHQAAVRDERLSELAFAYEAVAQGKRLKTLLPGLIAEYMYRAATFFGPVFGDELGATSYLERSLAASPAHGAAFEMLEAIYARAGDKKKLADLLAAAAPHRPRAEHVSTLRNSAALYEEIAGAEERAIDIYQQLLRLDPSDESARSLLEAKYLKANRYRDVARLLEQALTTEPAPEQSSALAIRARLIELYASQLHEPERSIPHVEELLAHDPTHEEGRRVATKLLAIKGLAARAAAALADAHDASGTAEEVARFLAIELEHTRGPKRLGVLRRIGVLRQDRLNDPPGAFEAYEAALAIDPADDDLRARYAAVASRLDKVLDAARTLSRASTATKESKVRARILAEMGELYREGGDLKKARTTFVSVMTMADEDAIATLRAARALVGIYANERDFPALADVLSRITDIDPDPEMKKVACEELAELTFTTLKDAPRSIAAWRKLADAELGSEREESRARRVRALTALEPLYEAAGNFAELAYVLDERAAMTSDPNEARPLAFRAAQVATTRGGDPVRAIAMWRRLVDTFGASREAFAEYVPLLEQQRQWVDLVAALTADAQLAPEAERAAILAKLGQVLLGRTRDVDAAIDAFRRVLAIDPTEAKTLATLEKLLAAGEHRLAAAEALEPIYRGEGSNAAGLLRVLDAKAQFGASVDARLSSLSEAMRIAEETPALAARAIDFAGRGLGESVANNRATEGWLEAVDRLAERGIDPKKVAALLAKAIGEHAVTNESVLHLVCRAGDALAATGDVAAAIASYKRALEYEPTSQPLLQRIDELYREQGSPRERIALYRASLERGVDDRRRRELLHTIATIEQHDLNDMPAAIAAYREAVAADPRDAEAHTELANLLESQGAWKEVCDALEAQAENVDEEEARHVRARFAEIAAAHGQEDRAREVARVLAEEGELDPADLDAIDRVATATGDIELSQAILEMRANEATEPREQVEWLDRLGDLAAEKSRDLERARATWMRAAKIALEATDDPRAITLLEKVRRIASDDRDAASQLLELRERIEQWNELPELIEVLVATEEDAAQKAALLLRMSRVFADKLGDAKRATDAAARAFTTDPRNRDALAAFEALALAQGDKDLFAIQIDDELAKLAEDEEDAILLADLRIAKARALASDRATHDMATATYREVLAMPELDDGRKRSVVLAFETLLASGDAASTTRADDRRWLASWKVDHATGEERAAALAAWAFAEEHVLGDPARALELHRLVLADDPEDAEALGAIARLSIAMGDVEGAVGALVARRDRSEGDARSALDLEIATILIERTERLSDALASIASVLENTPDDASALALSARLLASPVTHARAVEMLESAYESAEDADARVTILTRLLAEKSQPGEMIDLRRSWYERLLGLVEDAKNDALAHDIVLQAVEELPTVASLWDRADAIARKLKNPDGVAEIYRRAMTRTLPHDEALELGQRAVAFYEEWFEDSDRVVTILQRILEIDPTESWAFDRLKLLFDSAERWEELFALYDRALLAAGEEKKVELLEDVAQIAKDFANHSRRAIGYLEQLLALRPKSARVEAQLERLYERHGCHRELIALLSSRLPKLAAKEQQEVRGRIASLWLDELHDAANALLVVEDILARETTKAESDAVCALLERILTAAPPHAEARESIMPPDPSARRDSVPPSRAGVSPSAAPKRMLVRQRAAALLKDRYLEAGRDADLVRILEVELEAVKNAKERIRRHQQIATLYAQLGNDTRAMDHYVALVLLEPDDAAHREQLAAIAGKLDRYDRLAEVLVAAADDCTDDTLKIDLLMHAADVCATKLADRGRAIELYFRILLVSPIADALLLAACRRIEPLLAAAERDRERLDVLERLAVLETEGDVREEVLRAAATLATALGETERAIWAWESRLKARPGDADALDGLAALFQRERRWRPLLDVLRQRAESSGRDDESKRADRVLVAMILSDELGASDEAIVSWQEVEETFGASEESTRALAVLLRGARKWSELATLLARAAKAATGAARAARLCELGDVEREHLGDQARAIASYRAALEVDSRSEGARAGLRALLAAAEHRAAAVGTLFAAYEAADDWTLILELTDHRLSAAIDDAARKKVLREVARIAETRANDDELAFSSIRRAFAIAPSDETIQSEFVRLAQRTKQWRALVEAEREAIDAAEASADRGAWVAALRFAMGSVLETELEDPRAALAAYARVSADEPKDEDAARATIRVAARVARWDAAARVVIEAASALGVTPKLLFTEIEEGASSFNAWEGAAGALATALGERSDLPATIARDFEMRIASWHRDKRGDPDAAEAAYVRALAHDPANPDVLLELAQLQRRAKGRPLVESLLRLSAATGGDLELLREAAEIAVGSVQDRGLGKSILEKMLKLATDRWGGVDEMVSSGTPIAPINFADYAIGELVRIHDEEGDSERVLSILIDASKLPFETSKTRAMRHEAARIAEHKLNDEARAIALLAALFDEDPEDEWAVSKLVVLYTNSGKLRELLELKRKQTRVAKSAAARNTLRLESAPLLIALGDAAGAITTLRENLQDDPREPKTVAALADALERESRFTELAALLSDQAERAEAAFEAELAADAWARAAHLAETKLDDLAGAILHHKRVVAIDARPSSLDALARLSSARGDHTSAGEFLAQLLDVVSKEERPFVTFRLADALLAAGRRDAARARLEEASRESPDADPVRTRLAEIYRAQGEWRSLAALLAQGAAHAPDKAARLARLREAADLYRTLVDDASAAIPLLEQAADLEPEDRSIRLALADAFGAASRFEDARNILRALIDGFAGRRPKERAPVHYHLARLDLAVGDRARALVELDAATKIDPANPEILRTLAELARDDGQFDRAERSYRALLTVLRRIDDPENAPIVRTEVLLELSGIAERQDEHDRASELLESALEVAASSDVEAQRLEKVLRVRGDFATLVRALEARSTRLGDDARAAEALGELADLLDEKLGRTDEALAAKLRALALAPDSAALHTSALALARREAATQKYVDQVTTLAREAEESGDAARAAVLLLQLGGAMERELGDDRGAADFYERARAHAPKSAEALRALDRIYERLGDVTAQARILAERIADGADDDANADATYRLAALRMRDPKTIDEACDLLAAAIARAPDPERAEAILARAASDAPANERVLALYEQIARAPGHERALIDVLSRQWELAPTSTNAIREAIDLARKIEDNALAEALLRKLVAHEGEATDENETRTWALGALANLRLAAGDPREAIALKREAAKTADASVARALQFEVAKLAAGKLGELALAAEIYESLLEHEPTDRETWEPLLDVYRRALEIEKLSVLLERVAEFVSDPAERSRLRLERVRVMMDHLGLGDDAAPLLREIVDDDPSQTDAAILLSSILQKSGREDELADLLAKQLEGAKDRSDVASIASLSLRLGGLVVSKNPAEAKAVYYAALDWAPKSRDVLRALDKLHAQAGETSDRADVMERLLGVEEGLDAEQIALELSAIRAELWDEDGAERALELGFRAHPVSPSIRNRLETAYRDRGAWAKLAELYIVDANARPTSGQRAARLREAAAIYRNELQDPRAAATVLQDARAAGANDPALLADLVAMLAAAGDDEGAARELVAAIDALDPANPARAGMLAHRAALKIKLGDDEGAAADLEEAVAYGSPSHARELAAHLEKLGRAATEAGDTAKARAILVRRAQLFSKAGDHEEARALLAEVTRLDPKDRDALRALAQLEEQSEKWDAAGATYRRLIALEEGEQMIETALHLADVCERAGRLSDARGGLERARLAAPTNEVLRKRIEALYEQMGAWKELAELSLEDAKATLDVGGRFAHLMRAGTLLTESSEPHLAIEPLTEAHALRPADLECTVRLADAYVASSRLQDAADLLNNAVNAHRGRRSRELSMLHHRVATIARMTGDRENELAWLASALDIDSQNGVAASELGLLAMELGNIDVATRALRAVTMLKAPAPLTKALAYQYLGQIAQSQGDARRAILLVKRAIDEDPTLATAHELLAELQG